MSSKRSFGPARKPTSRLRERSPRRSLSRSRARAAFALAVALAAGCSDSEPSTASGPPGQEPTPPGAPLLAAGCTGKRWLATKSAPLTCPAAPPSWTGSDVFGAAAPPGLAPYCYYEWAGKGSPSAINIDALHKNLGSQGALAIEEDCAVVGPLAGDFALSVRPWLNGKLREGAGAMSPLPGGTPATIHVAVPDSSPDVGGPTIPGKLEHGYIMASIIHDLTCPAGGPCASHITTHMALPQVTNEEHDRIKGGYFGSRVELAQAIYAAVEGWKGALPARPRLTINLSVGWEPDMGCGSPSSPATMTIEQSVVFAAITHAVCHGALVVAAAGNSPGGPEPLYPSGWATPPAGPVCPAAWSTEPAPTAAQCDAFEIPGYASGLGGSSLLYTTPVPAPPQPVDNALLFAVGGVDYDDRPITRTRAFGLPRVAAIGLQGVAGNQGGAAMQPLTGTSVAAAVVSGAASAVWAYRPELTAPEVMDIVYRSGVLLPFGADFYSQGVNSEARRASLCSALAEACPANNTYPRCPPAGIVCPEGAPSALGSQNPPLTAALRDLLADDWDGTSAFFASPAPPALPAPEDEFRGVAVAPWVHPQPSRPPCGACVFEPGQSRLYVSIDANYPVNLTLSRMLLTLTGPHAQGQGRATVLVDLPSPSSMTRTTAPFTVQSINWSALSEVDTATLSWAVTDSQSGTTASVEEQILIDP